MRVFVLDLPTKYTVRVLSMLLCLNAASAAKAAQQDETSEIEVPSSAEKPVGAVNIGVVAGYGLTVLGAGTLTAQNPYAGGFGVQVDHQFESGVVLGFGVDYFFGESLPAAADAMGVVQPAQYARYLLCHGRLGYNIRMHAMGGRIDLRPSVWFGAALASVSEQPVFPAGRANAFLVAPGLSFHFLIGDSGWYAGEDIRVSLPMAEHARSAVLLLLAVGKHL